MSLEHMVIPKHVAVILDGNGRWARRRGVPRAMGHKAGCETLEKMVRIVRWWSGLWRTPPVWASGI